jgi:squalene-hopene/tetraprenyl-beta-curcumene cyclase
MEVGSDGVYYYYHTMAKALNAYGQELFTDAKGTEHTWRKELALQLIRHQKPEGYWVNDNPRWREDNPVLVTAYVILALEEILNSSQSASLLPPDILKK